MKKLLFMLLVVLAGALSINAETPKAMAYSSFHGLVECDGIAYGILEEDPSGLIVLWATLNDTDTLKIPESVTNDGKSYLVKKISSDMFSPKQKPWERPQFPIRIIEVPSTVNEIESIWLFGIKEDFFAINVDEKNPWFSSYNGILYSQNHSVVLACPRENPCAGLAPGVEEIGEDAFNSCKGISEINLPPTVTKINYGGFSDSNITKITLPSSLKYIGHYAFRGCHLTSIRLGTEIEYLGGGSLAAYTSLESIYCESPTPIRCELSPFDAGGNRNYICTHIHNNVTLYVPVGCVDAYRTAPYWGNIKHIEEYDYSSNTPVEAAVINIRAEDGAIVVSGNEATPVEVYRTDGTLVRRTADARIDGLPRGLYIVKVADTVKKISL